RASQYVFFFQAEDGIRGFHVTGVQTCALPIWCPASGSLDEVVPDGQIAAPAASLWQKRVDWKGVSDGCFLRRRSSGLFGGRDGGCRRLRTLPRAPVHPVNGPLVGRSAERRVGKGGGRCGLAPPAGRRRRSWRMGRAPRWRLVFGRKWRAGNAFRKAVFGVGARAGCSEVGTADAAG